MSRIGNKVIFLPEDVQFQQEAHTVHVKGPKGSLSQDISSDIQISVQDQELKLIRPTNQKRHRALHGLYRSLIQNMVTGVSKGYKKELEIIGVGYKASHQGQILELSLGYSHVIFMEIPKEIQVDTIQPKGKGGGSHPMIILQGTDKQLLGQVAAKIRSLRKAEPYKGKGIRFLGEYIRRKAGKTASKK